jgi:hypothetical protein
MKHSTVFVPLLLPKLSDRAAANLIDIVEQLLGIAQHHYGDQAHRWRRHQSNLAVGRSHLAAPLMDDPF